MEGSRESGAGNSGSDESTMGLSSCPGGRGRRGRKDPQGGGAEGSLTEGHVTEDIICPQRKETPDGTAVPHRGTQPLPFPALWLCSMVDFLHTSAFMCPLRARE